MNDWHRSAAGRPSTFAPLDANKAARARRVSRQPLHAEVTDRLREMIIYRAIKPGERINENELANLLDVSRTPLREALRALQAEGLIVHEPNRGSHVSHITLEHTAELFEAMAGIEGYCGRITARRISDDELVPFRDLHRKMFEFHHDDDRPSYFELNERIHRAFVELSGNSILVGVHTRLIIGAKRIRFTALQSKERWDESVADHKAILAAIEAHQADTVGPLIEQHVRETGKFVCDHLHQLEAMVAHQQSQHPKEWPSGF